jgi:hypothetical protein
VAKPVGSSTFQLPRARHPCQGDTRSQTGYSGSCRPRPASGSAARGCHPGASTYRDEVAGVEMGDANADAAQVEAHWQSARERGAPQVVSGICTLPTKLIRTDKAGFKDDRDGWARWRQTADQDPLERPPDGGLSPSRFAAQRSSASQRGRCSRLASASDRPG